MHSLAGSRFSTKHVAAVWIKLAGAVSGYRQYIDSADVPFISHYNQLLFGTGTSCRPARAIKSTDKRTVSILGVNSLILLVAC